VYLHSQKVIHGDLKAVNTIDRLPLLSLTGLFQTNVLIDGGGKALLCDFGLSRITVDTASRTKSSHVDVIVGSLQWMAPELLKGGSLKKPCDIYAFGMTLYEVSSVLVTSEI
jgi:serine/threonine protein kinase